MNKKQKWGIFLIVFPLIMMIVILASFALVNTLIAAGSPSVI